MIKNLTAEYKKRKPEIRKRLKEFKSVWERSDKKIFSELCFCICTPQSKAIYCDKAIAGLVKNNVLFKGTLKEIKAGLKGVRFPNNKARYIKETRRLFTVNGRLSVKSRITYKKESIWLLILSKNLHISGLNTWAAQYMQIHYMILA